MCNLEQCPVCDAEQPAEACVIGVSGDFVHYRCRYCGLTWCAEKDLRDALGSAPGDHLLDTYA